MTTPASGPPPQPTAATMRRLAFIQMFFRQGMDQSRQAEPLNVASVLTLHDTAELFLQLVGEHRGVNLPRFVHFHEYWKLLDPARDPNGVALTGERPMSRLNDLRTAFKHHGTTPSASAIEQACADVRAFLNANMPTVFGIAFDSIDMAEVIPQQIVRDKVRGATASAIGGDLVDGMCLLAEAYDDLFGITPGPPGRRSPAGQFGSTIRAMAEHDIAGALRPAPGDHIRRPASADHRHLASLIVSVARTTGEMQRAMQVIALGIDYRQFERFQQLTPKIFYYMDMHHERHSPPGYAPTDADFEFCRQFLVMAALRIAEQP
jgi:hypothetical protein